MQQTFDWLTGEKTEKLNPLKRSGVKRLHLKVFSAIRV